VRGWARIAPWMSTGRGLASGQEVVGSHAECSAESNDQVERGCRSLELDLGDVLGGDLDLVREVKVLEPKGRPWAAADAISLYGLTRWQGNAILPASGHKRLRSAGHPKHDLQCSAMQDCRWAYPLAQEPNPTGL
jgi:hypothetical protein